MFLSVIPKKKIPSHDPKDSVAINRRSNQDIAVNDVHDPKCILWVTTDELLVKRFAGRVG